MCYMMLKNVERTFEITKENQYTKITVKNNQIVKIIEGPKKIDETIDINQIATTKAKTYVKKLTNKNEK